MAEPVTVRMTKEEALRLLDEAPGSERPSKLNPSLTCTQAVQVIRDCVNAPKFADLDVLPEWVEIRVLQVTRNQKRPSGRRITRDVMTGYNR